MFSGLSVKRNVLLAPYTTFKLGGVADFFAIPKTWTELNCLFKEANKYKIPIYFIGNGSNLLISDQGVRGLVINFSGCFDSISISASGEEIIVGAAYSFSKLTKICLKLGWKIALGWVGVPGSVGGAIKMNAGTVFGNLGHSVKMVNLMNFNKTFFMSHEQIRFSYRDTEFPPNIALCSVYLSNKYIEPQYGKEFAKTAIELIRKRNRKQPTQRSIGSIFKNPKKYFAGHLIELFALKGYRIGGSKISETHANIFVNDGAATSRDMFELCQFARNIVYDQCKIRLEFEVKFWGFSER